MGDIFSACCCFSDDDDSSDSNVEWRIRNRARMYKSSGKNWFEGGDKAEIEARRAFKQDQWWRDN